MNNVPLLPARLDWPSAIGDFLLKFGTLDYLVFVFLKNTLETAEFVKYKKRHFKDRTLRLAQHFKEMGSPTESQEEFSKLLARLDPVRDLRNHIAHGYMLARLDIETDTLLISVSLPKDIDQEYLEETRHVTFDELRANLNELTELIEAFKGIAGFKPERSP
jgi:hypothetical protein